jgi:hypothetical protein
VKHQELVALVGFVCLRKRTSLGVFWARQWKILFRKGEFWKADSLSWRYKYLLELSHRDVFLMINLQGGINFM